MRPLPVLSAQLVLSYTAEKLCGSSNDTIPPARKELTIAIKLSWAEQEQRSLRRKLAT